MRIFFFKDCGILCTAIIPAASSEVTTNQYLILDGTDWISLKAEKYLSRGLSKKSYMKYNLLYELIPNDLLIKHQVIC